MIRIIAIKRPSEVEGEMSPYPTVVAVTKDHHIPSEKLMPSAKCIAMPPIAIKKDVMSSIYLKPLVFRKVFNLPTSRKEKAKKRGKPST